MTFDAMEPLTHETFAELVLAGRRSVRRATGVAFASTLMLPVPVAGVVVALLDQDPTRPTWAVVTAAAAFTWIAASQLRSAWASVAVARREALHPFRDPTRRLGRNVNVPAKPYVD